MESPPFDYEFESLLRRILRGSLKTRRGRKNISIYVLCAT